MSTIACAPAYNILRVWVTAQRAGNLAALFTDQGGERPAAWRNNLIMRIGCRAICLRNGTSSRSTSVL
jgi:hypothetical protein